MGQWFRNLSITTRATLLLSLTALLFLALLAAAGYQAARSELEQTIAVNQTAMIKGLAEQLDSELQGTVAFLHHLGDHLQQEPQWLSGGRQQEFLNRHDETRLFFDAGLLLLSPRGRILAEIPYRYERIGQDRSSRDYFTRALAADRVEVSPPYRWSLPPHKPVIAFSLPLRDRQGRLRAVLVGRQSLADNRYFRDLVGAPVGAGGYLYLFSADRLLLMHPDPKRVLETVAPGRNQAIDAALQGWSGTRENVNTRGTAGLTTIIPLKNAPWYLAAHYPLAAAYAPLKRARTAFIVILLLSIPCAVAAVRLSMQPVVGPLTRLTRHLRQLPEKRGEERFLPVTSRDEVGRLSQVFNDLLQELDNDAAAREEAAEMYRVVTEFTSEVAVWQLPDGDIRYISPNCVELFGRPAAAFYADPGLLAASIHPDDRADWDRHTPGSCASSGSGIEFRICRPDGATGYVRHRCRPVVDRHGREHGVRSSWLDNTARHRLESGMRRLSRAVEQSASAILMTDTAGTIEYVNPRLCSSSGYAADELLGASPRLFKSGETPAETYAELWRTISSGLEWRGEFHNRRKDGTLYWEAATISPLYNSAGVITGYLAVKEDITERKESEQRTSLLLHQIGLAKREWEQTLDHLQDFILLTDTEHRIRRYNRLLADVGNRSADGLLGHDWRQLLQELGFRFVEFNGTAGELLHDRSRRAYDIRVYPIRSELDELQGYVVSMNDITELRATAAELETALAELGQAQARVYQQEKLASIGQLAAGVAHEINNPMGFITSNLGSLDKYVGRLAEYIATVDRALQECGVGDHAAPVQEARKRLKIDHILEDARQLIAESQDGAARVRRIVQDLKSFSRVDQAETALIDLNEALETTINIACNELKYVAELKREFGDIPQVRCFPQQLNQVFLNLLVNAAQALGETRGEITVRTRQEGDWVLAEVSDTGCGMSEEVQRRIFEPFFTTKEVGKGTGLGLSISYDIVKKHGGMLTVQSEEGHGTTFTVRLPVEGAAA